MKATLLLLGLLLAPIAAAGVPYGAGGAGPTAPVTNTTPSESTGFATGLSATAWIVLIVLAVVVIAGVATAMRRRRDGL